MGKEADKHFELVHLEVICNMYERAAKLSGTRQGCLVSMQHPISCMELILDSTENNLRGENASRKNPSRAARAARESESQVEIASYSKENPNTVDPFSCSGIDANPNTQVDLNLMSPSLGGSIPSVHTMVTEVLESLGLDGLNICEEEFKDYMEKCLDCDLKVQFDWQIKPVNLLANLEELLKDIEAIIDDIMAALDPFNLLQDLCNLFDGFKIFCIPDLIMLLVALQLLIKKYMTFSIELMLDWTMIVGPLLKLITDAIAGLIEQLKQMLIAPLDCILGALRTVDSLVDAFADTVATMAAAGQAFGDSLPGGDPSGMKADVEPTGGVEWDGGTSQPEQYDDSGQETDEWRERSSGDTTADAGPGGIGGLKSSEDSGFPTGFSLKASDGFGDYMGKNAKMGQKIKDLSPIKQLILAVQEVKEWITKLFSNILFAIKSLNAFVSGGLSLNVGSMGIILLLLQLIAFIKLIIELKGLNMEDCEALKNNPQALYDAIGTVYSDIELTTDGDQIIITDASRTWESKVNPQDACQLPDADERMVQQRIRDIVGTA